MIRKILNKIIRVVHTNPIRILMKATLWEDMYSIAYRRTMGNNKKWRILRNNSFIADPLLFEYEGRDYVFAEKIDANKKGIIGYFILDELTSDINKTSIEEKYHMSFPTIFKWNKKIYMIPETSQDKTICLYRAKVFPDSWEKVCAYPIKEFCLGSEECVDSVVLKVDGKKVSVIGSLVNSANPLKCKFVKYYFYDNNGSITLRLDSDIGRKNDYSYKSRCAGGIIKKKYLPVQESTLTEYGVNVLLFRITDLEDANYDIEKCKPQKKISPKDICLDIKSNKINNYHIDGIHTYGCNDMWEVVDIRYLRLNPLKWFQRAKRFIEIVHR